MNLQKLSVLQGEGQVVNRMVCLLESRRIEGSFLRSCRFAEELSLIVGTNRLYRIGYLLAVYSGVRAAFNRIRHSFLPALRVRTMDGRRLHVNSVIEVELRVHARIPASPALRKRRAGMISVRLVSPEISRSLYALGCATSHFGCGQIEIAFHEDGDRVVCYAVRNIVRANAERIGFGSLLRKLSLWNDEDEVDLLREVLKCAAAHGFDASLADPEDCVALSVDQRLLPPENRAKALESLRRKYARLERQLGTPAQRVPKVA